MSNLVGQQAPNFSAKAVVNGEIVSDYTLNHKEGAYTILFFYPADFSAVCPSEMIAFQKRLDQFTERNCTLVGCSVDDADSHHKWVNTPLAENGVQGVTYPIVADDSTKISEDYGVLMGGKAARGLFLIDGTGKVRSQQVYEMPIARSADEALRLLDSTIMLDTKGELCLPS